MGAEDVVVEEAVDDTATGLSAFNLRVNLTLRTIYGFDPVSFSRAAISSILWYVTVSFISSLLY